MDYNELQMKAATDAEFRASLLAEPAKALAEMGVELPADVSVRLVESTPEEIVLTIPPMLPDNAELDEDALASVSGGSTPTCWYALIYAGMVGLGAGSFAGGYTAGKALK